MNSVLTAIFRIVRLYALAIWVGGLVFFGFVAAVAFGTLADTHQAGLVVRGSLTSLHHIGMGAGLVYLLLTLALLAVQHGRYPIRAAELVLVLAMLALTIYSQYSIIPRMDTDLNAVGGEITKAPANAPARMDFNRLHKDSVNVEGVVLIEGLVLLGIAAVS